MNEQDLKNLLQESTLTPSADFSQKLMRKVEAQTAPAPPKKWMPFVLGIACLATVIILAFLPINNIVLFDRQLQIPSLSIQLAAVLVLLYELHQILELYSNTASIKQLSQHEPR